MDRKIGIVLAGGTGVRFKGSKPKQYININGKEMISYAIDAMKNAQATDDVIVVLDADEYENGRIKEQYCVRTVKGGITRNHSLRNSLDYIKKNYPDCESVIEVNAACPLIRSDIIDEMLTLIDNYDCVQCAYRITDALGSYKMRNVDRDDYFLIQSPTAYRFDMLYNFFDAESTNCHPGNLLPESAKIYNYYGFQPNFKVTYPTDVIIAETMLNMRGLE